jgi:hypothetical protein
LNNTEYAANDPLMAFKKINLHSLKRWDQIDSFGQMMMEAAVANKFVEPTPAYYVRKNFKPVKAFYTDICLTSESNMREVVYANGLLMNWKYDGKKWSMTDSLRTNMDDYFSCFSLKGVNYMMNAEGQVFDLDHGMKPVANTGCDLGTYLLIVDKDNGKLYRLPFTEASFGDHSLFQWIDEGAAISIFEPQ